MGAILKNEIPYGGSTPQAQADQNQATSTDPSYIKNKPTLGSASEKDVPSSGDASSTQVVMGDDSRLTNARTPVSHTHTASEITDISNYIAKSQTAGLMKNDGTVDTNTYAQTSALSDYIAKSNTSGLVKNDGTIDTNTYAQTSALPGAATSSVIGLVKPDETTLTVDANGTMSALSSGGDTMSKKRYTITATNQSNATDANGYYTYNVTLSNPTLDTTYAPAVYLTGANDNTFYTDTEYEMYSFLDQCNLTTANNLTLYATQKPESNFYIFIEGKAAS